LKAGRIAHLPSGTLHKSTGKAIPRLSGLMIESSRLA
jgi:hypothetical protein